MAHEFVKWKRLNVDSFKGDMNFVEVSSS